MTDEKPAPAAEPEAPNILDVDIVSYATAVGHSAARRLAELLAPDHDPDLWFCDRASSLSHKAAEREVMKLGSYVCSRPGALAGETLFRFACSQEASGFADGNDWPKLEPWMREAYSVFVGTASDTFSRLDQMQVVVRTEQEQQAYRDSLKPPGAVDPDDDAFGGHDGGGDGTFGGKAKPAKKPARKRGKAKK